MWYLGYNRYTDEEKSKAIEILKFYQSKLNQFEDLQNDTPIECTIKIDRIRLAIKCIQYYYDIIE